MKILKKLTINSRIAKVWDVLGNQFEHIDRWSSLIEKSEVSWVQNFQVYISL
jgi:hypothetical protein